MTFTTVLIFLILFAAVSFVQNAAFTWSSRSRNSNDPNYHRKASWASNGVYYITNALLTLYIVKFQAWYLLLAQGLVYTISTAEGSVLMMKRLLKKEAGKRKVGNQFTDYEAQELRTILNERQRSMSDSAAKAPRNEAVKPLPTTALPCAGVSLEKAAWLK